MGATTGITRGFGVALIFASHLLRHPHRHSPSGRSLTQLHPSDVFFAVTSSPVVIVHDVPSLGHRDFGSSSALTAAAPTAIDLLEHLDESVLAHLPAELTPLCCLPGGKDGFRTRANEGYGDASSRHRSETILPLTCRSMFSRA